MLIIQGHFGALEFGTAQKEKGKESYGGVMYLKPSSDVVVFLRAGPQVQILFA